MNCPHCRKLVHGFTGFQELQAFQKHLKRCRKNPNNVVLTDGRRTVVTPIKEQDTREALRIRAASGQ